MDGRADLHLDLARAAGLVADGAVGPALHDVALPRALAGELEVGGEGGVVVDDELAGDGACGGGAAEGV